MIPLCVPNLSGNEARYLQECIDTNFVSSVGPFVERFEALVAAASGSPLAVATASGTAGLHAALTAIDVRRDDLVILPSLTFIASANAIAYCGAQPWLLDVDAASWTLDAEAVARALDAEAERRGGAVVHRPTGRRVSAILPVYTLGTPADMDRLCELAAAWRLPIVADAAAALGARYRGREVGALGADLTVFSFNGNKTVTAGGGGAVAGAEPELARLVRHLTTTARSGADYHHDRVGFNYRMTNLQAAVGCAQLEQLPAFVAAKRRIAAAYDDALAGLPGVAPFPMPGWAEGARWLSGFTLERPAAAELAARLRARGIECRPFWKPIALQPPYRAAPRRDTPVVDRTWQRIVTLPCSTHLSPADQRQVIEAVRQCLPESRSAV